MTKAFETVLDTYQQSNYGQRYSTARGLDYRAGLLPRHERATIVETMKASHFVYQLEQEVLKRQARKKARNERYLYHALAAQASGGKKQKEDADDLVGFFYRPVMICSTRRRKYKTRKSNKRRYELVELRNPGGHREFLICAVVTRRLVEWKELHDVDSVREYLERHGFPVDTCFSKEDFLNEVKNGRGKLFLCVKKQRTAEFVLDLCHALIGESA